MKPALKFITVYISLSAVLGGLAWLQSFPTRPTSWLSWVLLFALIVPITFAAEFVGELIFSNPFNQAVERHTKNKNFSWLRIFAGVMLMLFVFAALFGLSRLYA